MRNKPQNKCIYVEFPLNRSQHLDLHSVLADVRYLWLYVLLLFISKLFAWNSLFALDSFEICLTSVFTLLFLSFLGRLLLCINISYTILHIVWKIKGFSILSDFFIIKQNKKHKGFNTNIHYSNENKTYCLLCNWSVGYRRAALVLCFLYHVRCGF